MPLPSASYSLIHCPQCRLGFLERAGVTVARSNLIRHKKAQAPEPSDLPIGPLHPPDPSNRLAINPYHAAVSRVRECLAHCPWHASILAQIGTKNKTGTTCTSEVGCGFLLT